MEKFIMAIDQGTTSTRAILFDHERNVVAMSQKETTLFYPQPGWVEQDANDIYLSTLAVCMDVISKAKISPKQIASIGISNQRETTIIWDKETGLPIYHAIVWQSKQTDGICDEWKEKGYESIISKKTGMRIDPYFSASKIVWILNHVEGAKEKAKKGGLLFGTVDSWLVWKLTGQQVHITDVSNASRTLLFNIETCTWDDELLELFDIPKAILPEIKATSCHYGNTSPYLFLNEEIPICAVVGDQQAALFGQGCYEMGSVKNTYGTGGFMLMNTGDKIVRSNSGLVSTVAWKIGDKITYALEGSIFVSGSLIKWLRDELKIINSASQTEQMALSVDSCNGLYIVPAFVGLGAPYWNDKCRASIVGLTFGTNKNHLVRAALEAMAFQSKDVLEAMVEDSGVAISSIKVDGGAAANNFLLQFQSDILMCDIERYKINELTALGAAYLAGLSCSYWTYDDLKMDLDRVFKPSRSKENIDKIYGGWKKAVHACMEF
ncbi:MAG: glycerol kinase GlpK [Erysipelotrichaceae bacterium]|uniref:glycerol kinase GlpK n=1 Tax=Floccifex sp. TaxID=2815810 RepID=UPI002A758F9F|nr:glycerol kinase GlpK [Floccifex sp.]MDD7281868.1 glycerol kinase GlpK [Erysipelotrichaceae bacterium]MDY2958111.1 glycerol kinase GlpK [Floccifex sp.]